MIIARLASILKLAFVSVLDSIVVSIPACHAGDRGSIPRRGDYFLIWNWLSRWVQHCSHTYIVLQRSYDWKFIYEIMYIGKFKQVLQSVVRMAERSKAPDSRENLLCKYVAEWVFWSTNVGVGSNPTSDKTFTYWIVSKFVANQLETSPLKDCPWKGPDERC